MCLGWVECVCACLAVYTNEGDCVCAHLLEHLFIVGGRGKRKDKGKGGEKMEIKMKREKNERKKESKNNF